MAEHPQRIPAQIGTLIIPIRILPMQMPSPTPIGILTGEDECHSCFRKTEFRYLLPLLQYGIFGNWMVCEPCKRIIDNYLGKKIDIVR